MDWRNKSSFHQELEDDSGIENNTADMDEATVYIRISIPEINVQKCLQFRSDATVWVAKQQILSTLAKDLKDGLNYGLYCPPENGKAGKFLEEERPLHDYPLTGPIGFLEFKYKRRVYKLMNVNPRKLKQLHTKANVRHFMECVRAGDLEKITRFCNKGLDPNLFEKETGETPLTIAATMGRARPVILTLVSGGAHIDFRSRDGFTPIHKAARKGNMEALKTLLDLGASPNYKDSRGITPLYLTCSSDTPPRVVELLLHDHAVIGATDDRGWTETHQVCKYGRVQHLEHLLFYGANMNVQNSSGNTPLHVCAVDNQESCARVLLFRGADKTIQNFANQDAYHTALIAGNHELARIIEKHDPQEAVPFQEVPKYNDKRRGPIDNFRATLVRSRSDPRLNENLHQDYRLKTSQTVRALPHFRSNDNLMDECNGGVMFDRSALDSPRSTSISSAGSGGLPPSLLRKMRCYSYCSGNADEAIYESLLDFSNKAPVKRLYLTPPGCMFVCVRSFDPQEVGDLRLNKGDVVEVLSVGEQGFWEGRVGNKEGWFPSNHVQEVKMSRQNSSDKDDILIKRDTLTAIASGTREYAPRTVVLQRGKGGFGFVLRGAKSQDPRARILDFSPSTEFPALQYLDRVEKGSMADKAGLKPGDFLLEINNKDVTRASHEHTVGMIKQSGDTLAMKVVTVQKATVTERENKIMSVHMDGTRTLPLKKKAVPSPPQRDPQTSLTVSKNNAHLQAVAETMAAVETLDQAISSYDDDNSSTIDINTLRQAQYVDPKNKTASIGRTHGKRLSTFEMNDLFVREGATVINTEESASHQIKPVVSNMPKYPGDVPDPRARMHSSPEVLDGRDSHYATHVTRLDVSQIGNTGAVAQGSNSEYSRTVVDIAEAGSDSSSQGYGSDKHPVYAVPSKAAAQDIRKELRRNSIESSDSSGGSASQRMRAARPREPAPPPPTAPPAAREPIPPPPDYPSPEPANVVKINTKQTVYSNVSQNITQQKAAEQDVESSFRPGANARMTSEAAHVPAHSRTSSGSSNASATKPQDMKMGAAFAITATAVSSNQTRSESRPYYEPEPDYDESPAKDDGPLSPPVDYEDNNDSNSFQNAIKMAALQREKRRQEGNLNNSTKETTPEQSRVPPHVQKQIEENRKQEQSHSALLAAIAKRRTLVDSTDMERVATSIDSKVQQQKVVQKTYYGRAKSDNPAPAHAAALAVSSTSHDAPSMVKTEEPPPPPPPTAPVPPAPPLAADSGKASPVDFKVLAERKRQEWLQKRQGSTSGTLEKPAKRDQKAETSVRPEPPSAPPPPVVEPKVPVVRESKPVTNGVSNTESNSSMGGLADIVALRARQKSYEGTVESVEKNPKSGKTIFSSVPSQNRPKSTRLATNGTVPVKGATTDASVTETPTVTKKQAPPPPASVGNSSVLARSKLLEAKLSLGQTSGGVTKTSYTSKSSINESPPPMIPPQQKSSTSVTSSVSTNKLTNHRNSPSVVGYEHNGLAHIAIIQDRNTEPELDIPIVPPPPMFEASTLNENKMEDNASMVSSVSTLSSLSGDNSVAQSPRHSANKGSFSIVPPPPPMDFGDPGDIVPPPMEFGTGDLPSPLGLKSVKRTSTSNSMQFPAVTGPRSK